MSNIPQELAQIQQLVNRFGVAWLLRFVACDCADRATGDDSARWDQISRRIVRLADQIAAVEPPRSIVMEPEEKKEGERLLKEQRRKKER
jgi:hypothetical protein